MPEQIFWVFGRREPGEALQQVGVVKAPSPALAYVYARMNYTERPWHDLCVVPKQAFFALQAATGEKQTP